MDKSLHPKKVMKKAPKSLSQEAAFPPARLLQSECGWLASGCACAGAPENGSHEPQGSTRNTCRKERQRDERSREGARRRASRVPSDRPWVIPRDNF